MSKSWWENKEWPKLGSGYPGIDFPTLSLFQDAVTGSGACVLERCFEGSLKGEVSDLIKKIEGIGGRPVVQTGVTDYQITWNRGFSRIWINSGDCEARIVTDSAELFDAFCAVANDSIGPRISAGKAYVLITTQEGPKLQSLGVASSVFERGNYEADVVKDFDHVIADLKTSNPCGKLVILDGTPGTGKTYLVKALLHEVSDALFIIIPAHLVPSLADPGMISALIEVRKNKGDSPTVFIIEDADDCLAPRSSDNIHAISSLLNLGDGIVGAALDIRLICTTNARGEELDQAVLRPGRLCRRIEVGLLTADTATAIYKRLTGSEKRLTKDLTLAEVYRLARDGGWVPAARKTIGFRNGVVSGPFDEDDISLSTAEMLDKLTRG